MRPTRLLDSYKLIGGYFYFDDDIDGANSDTQDGFNLTLEKHYSDDFRVFAEWLTRNFDERSDRHTFSVGFRYDFGVTF